MRCDLNGSNQQQPLGPIPPNWKYVRLVDIATKIGSGATPRGGASTYLEHRKTYALIRSQNVFDRHFSESGLAFISDHQADRLANAKVRSGDVLLNITGDGITFGRACLAPDDQLPAFVNQHVAIIRVNQEVCIPGYLLSYLTHPDIKVYIESFNAGGSRRAITKGHIESFRIPLPPLPEQKRIAHILGSLDDKIELNRQMNQTLEAMAQALFKSWFIDFDPVHAKMEGRDPSGMDPQTAALFPNKLTDSPLGPIPQGWKVGKMGDIMKSVSEGIDPTQVPPDTPYIGLGNMPEGSIALDDWGTAGEVTSRKYQFKKGQILFGRLRPYFRKVGIAPVDGISSTDIQIIEPRKPGWYGYLLCQLTYPPFIDYCTNVSSGTRMPRVKWGDMQRYPIAIAPIEIVEAFTNKVKPMLFQTVSNIHEGKRVSEIRETLLPELLNG